MKSLKTIIPLAGAIGNQLFIAMAALYLREIHGREVALSPIRRTGDQLHHNTVTNIFETQFANSTQLRIATEIDEIIVFMSRVEKKLLSLFGQDAEGLLFYRELDGRPDYSFQSFGRKWVNYGYFQTSYFLNQLRSRGLVGDIQLSANDSRPRELDGVCGVHIRRGDYLLAPNKNTIGSLAMDYFLTSARLMRGETGIERLEIFTDAKDPEIELELMRLGFDVKRMSSHSPIDDLEHLASYKHLIISNSSYSWWAANMRQVPYVIAPDPWFRQLSNNELHQRNWRKQASVWI